MYDVSHLTPQVGSNPVPHTLCLGLKTRSTLHIPRGDEQRQLATAHGAERFKRGSKLGGVVSGCRLEVAPVQNRGDELAHLELSQSPAYTVVKPGAEGEECAGVVVEVYGPLTIDPPLRHERRRLGEIAIVVVQGPGANVALMARSIDCQLRHFWVKEWGGK